MSDRAFSGASPEELKGKVDNEGCSIEVAVAPAEGGWGARCPLMPPQSLPLAHHRLPHVCSTMRSNMST